MNCDDIQSLLAAQLYETLNEDDRQAVQEHVAVCDHCAREAKAMQMVQKLMDDPDDGCEANPLSISELVRSATGKVSRSRRRWRYAACLAIAASLLLAIVQILSLEVSVDSDGLRIARNVMPTREQPAAPTGISQIVDDHAQRLDDLDLLLQLLMQTKGTDRRQVDRELMALRTELRTLQQRHSTMRRTLNVLLRQPSTDDLASMTKQVSFKGEQ
ncbi:MAG: zf-HC2 domain-containing protein [Pirellulales bacterium]|nr:zf-HC2 domain-containing protein [Pirellulales bacterium]